MAEVADVPVVLTSATRAAELDAFARDRGAAAPIAKAFDADAFLATVGRLVAGVPWDSCCVRPAGSSGTPGSAARSRSATLTRPRATSPLPPSSRDPTPPRRRADAKVAADASALAPGPVVPASLRKKAAQLGASHEAVRQAMIGAGMPADYVLLKLYGDRGVALAGFLGGLVNSTVTVTELARRVRETGGRLADAAFRGVMLSNAAMAARNAVLLGILAAPALVAAALPLGLLLAASAGLAMLPRDGADADGARIVQLESPFSLGSALRFGAIFLGLQIVGGVAQAELGDVGFYAVSLMGGLVSSASSVASAAALASRGTVAPDVAGTGAVLASLASSGVNLPLFARVSGDPGLTRRLARALALAIAAALIGAAAQLVLAPYA